MKKYVFTSLLAVICGLFLFNFFLNMYKNPSSIKVINTSDTLYFIQYGVYSSLESMEENTINLQNYIYNEEDGKYYVFVGITKNKKCVEKIEKYYKTLGNETIVKEFTVSNKKFLNSIDTYDQVLLESTDSTVTSSIISQVLIKYEEVVINGNKD